MNLHAHYHVSKFDQRQGVHYCNRGPVFEKKSITSNIYLCKGGILKKPPGKTDH